MKTTISLQPTLKARIASSIKNWLVSDNQIFSKIMEEKVSNQSTLLIIHAVLSLSAFLIFAPLSAMAAICLLLWFVQSLILCKRGGIK